MNPAIDAATRARLAWLMEQLTRLHDYQYVRSEGNHVFQAARQDLADIIANAVEPVTNPPATVLAVMTQDQFKDATGQLQEVVTAKFAQMGDMIESSELAVVDAVAATRADVLAAMPAPEIGRAHV